MATSLAPHSVPTDAVAPSAAPAATEPPLLLLFSSRRSGQARRVEGYVSHCLQRRHNHDSFRFHTVDVEERPDLFEKLGVSQVPSLVVIENQSVACKLEGYVRPGELEAALQPWLH